MAIPSKPTKEQWAEVERKLSTPYCSVYFLIDGYAVATQVERDKMRLVIAVYVNGKITGKNIWHGRENEIDKLPDIARRFYALKSQGCPAKEIKQYERAFGKREAKKMGIYDRFFYTVPFFSTPGAFIRHIKKHNQSIEIIDYDACKKAMEPLQRDAAPEVASV